MECAGWINAHNLCSFIGSMVTIVGRNVSEHRDEKAEFVFEDGNGARFKVLVPENDFAGYAQGTVVEVTGRVLDNDCILQLRFHDWGVNANLRLWTKLIEMTRKFPEIF